MLRTLEAYWNTYVRIPLRPTMPPAYWEGQDPSGLHGAEKYATIQPSATRLLEEVMAQCPNRFSSILDVGCNHGLHLTWLASHGYRRLDGVDVVAPIPYHRGTFQEVLPGLADHRYAVVFTHGATIELVPPTFPICQEMARIAHRAVVLMIQERSHAYPRLYEREFEKVGWRCVKRELQEGDQVLLVFQP